jgi:endonuclease-8
MPEGDTILRAAMRLHAALTGRTVTAFRSRLNELALAARRHRVVGSTIDAVEARGKHLLMRFSTGDALHTHMGMTGSWHLYRPGSPWRQAEAKARVVLEAGDVIAVCFVPRVAELVPAAAEAGHPSLSHLGPDVLAPARDSAPGVTGLRARGADEIGAALLDQTAISGVGNIWKSEGLFLAGVDPFARVAELDEATLTRVVRAAMREMHRSVQAGKGEPEGQGRSRFWVYRRSGRPCRRCGTVIAMQRQGPMSRSTYWCPRCQPSVNEPRPGRAAPSSRGRAR